MLYKVLNTQIIIFLDTHAALPYDGQTRGSDHRIRFPWMLGTPLVHLLMCMKVRMTVTLILWHNWCCTKVSVHTLESIIPYWLNRRFSYLHVDDDATTRISQLPTELWHKIIQFALESSSMITMYNLRCVSKDFLSAVRYFSKDPCIHTSPNIASELNLPWQDDNLSNLIIINHTFMFSTYQWPVDHIVVLWLRFCA